MSAGAPGRAAAVRRAGGEEEAVRFFQALGDVTRLELLDRLREAERTVGELVDALRCPQPKVSRHLKVLKDAGLVADRRDGRHVTYARTDPSSWSESARRWLARLDARPAAGGPARGARPAARRTRRRGVEPERNATPPAPPEPARPPEPDRAPAAKPRRRQDLETHLL